MTILVAIPAYRVQCRVWINKGRTWSVIDELILFLITRRGKTISDLSAEMAMPRQIVAASITRMMRFRLIEVTLTSSGAAFRASDYGFRQISSGEPLPYFPKQFTRPISFVVERISGQVFARRDVRIMPQRKLSQEQANGADVRTIVVTGGDPSMTHAANFNRLSDLVARGPDEEISHPHGRTSSVTREFTVVRIEDGVTRELPPDASVPLRAAISDAASGAARSGDVTVQYAGLDSAEDLQVRMIECNFDSRDLIIGGPAHRDCLSGLLAGAASRVMLHSTFLALDRFLDCFDEIRAACERGVLVDILWGAERDDETEKRNALVAGQIAEIVRADPIARDRIFVQQRSTGSHAKLLIADTTDGDFIAVIGSCNWLRTEFKSIEISVILRDPHAVAEAATAFQNVVGRRGLVEDLASEFAILARDLRRKPRTVGSSKIGLIIGPAHDALLRSASGVAGQRLVIGCDKIGATARPGAIMPGEVAAAREGVKVTVITSSPSGPIKNRHRRELATDAATRSVRLVPTRKARLHGKFVAWDDDDVIVTSLNWASAAADHDFPWGEIGVHISSPGVGAMMIQTLESMLPELKEEDSRTRSSGESNSAVDETSAH